MGLEHVHSLFWKLVPVPHHHHGKKIFLTSNQTFPYYTLCPLPLILSVYLQEKSSSISSTPFTQALVGSTKVISCHLF